MAAEAAEQLAASDGQGAAVGVIATLLANLSREPANGKFRRVPTTNARIAAALAHPGAEALLLAGGFERAVDALAVPAEMGELEAGALAAAALSDLDGAVVAAGAVVAEAGASSNSSKTPP